MTALATLYAILKVLGTLISFWFGISKMYRWIRRKLNKRKPTV